MNSQNITKNKETFEINIKCVNLYNLWVEQGRIALVILKYSVNNSL